MAVLRPPKWRCQRSAASRDSFPEEPAEQTCEPAPGEEIRLAVTILDRGSPEIQANDVSRFYSAT